MQNERLDKLDVPKLVKSLEGVVFPFPEDNILYDIAKFSRKVSKDKHDDNVYHNQEDLETIIKQCAQGKLAEYPIGEALYPYGCPKFDLTDMPNWTDFTFLDYFLHVKSVSFESIFKYGESYTFQCSDYKGGRMDPLFNRMNSDNDIIICCIVDYTNKKIIVRYVFVWKDISRLLNIDKETDLLSTWHEKRFLHIDKIIKDPKYKHLFT